MQGREFEPRMTAAHPSNVSTGIELTGWGCFSGGVGLSLVD